MRLFHITSQHAWSQAQGGGVYRTASLETDGFIHLSLARQWPLTARRFFRGHRDLALLVLEADRLSAPVRYEPADGDWFPHLFGALNLDAVRDVVSFDVDGDGHSTRAVVEAFGFAGR